MKIVIEIGAHDGDDHVIHFTADKFPLRIGRGYNNDIILQDPHISSHHAEILHNGTDWVLSDMGSANGSRVNGKDCKDGTAILHSGDRVTLGRTTLRVYDPLHPVPAATPLETQSGTFRALQGRVLPWVLFFAAILATSGILYFQMWMEDAKSQITLFAAATGMLMILWALPWAVTGRLTRHRSYFQTQVALAALYVLATSLVWPLQTVLDFYTNENPVSIAVEYVYQIVFLGMLIYGALSVSTYMAKKRRKVMAAFFAVGFVTIIYGAGYISKENFEFQPSYPTVLEPYLDRWVKTDTLDGFMTGNTDLFDTKTLSEDTL
jgi:pSer/pThr/pTyr-binding forkhead associated (FHA) protein